MSLSPPQPTPPPAQIAHSPRTPLQSPLPPPPEEISPLQLPPAIHNGLQHEYSPACTCSLCMQTPQPFVLAFPPPIHHEAAPDPDTNMPEFELPSSVYAMPEQEDTGSQSPGSSDKSTVLSMPLSPTPAMTDTSPD